MKGKWQAFLFALVFGVVMPWVVCAIGGRSIVPNITGEEIEITVAKPQRETIGVLTKDGLRQMLLDDYLTGVLLGELPERDVSRQRRNKCTLAGHAIYQPPLPAQIVCLSNRGEVQIKIIRQLALRREFGSDGKFSGNNILLKRVGERKIVGTLDLALIRSPAQIKVFKRVCRHFIVIHTIS